MEDELTMPHRKTTACDDFIVVHNDSNASVCPKQSVNLSGRVKPHVRNPMCGFVVSRCAKTFVDEFGQPSGERFA